MYTVNILIKWANNLIENTQRKIYTTGTIDFVSTFLRLLGNSFAVGILSYKRTASENFIKVLIFL